LWDDGYGKQRIGNGRGIGLALPDIADMPSVYAQRIQAAEATGIKIVELVERDIPHSDILHRGQAWRENSRNGNSYNITSKPGDLVLTKQRTGPFTTTNLNEVLKRLGVDKLVLMGIATFGCVLTTVRWAADMYYKLVVVSDCCSNPPDAEVHRVLWKKYCQLRLVWSFASSF